MNFEAIFRSFNFLFSCKLQPCATFVQPCALGSVHVYIDNTMGSIHHESHKKIIDYRQIVLQKVVTSRKNSSMISTNDTNGNEFFMYEFNFMCTVQCAVIKVTSPEISDNFIHNIQSY